MADEITLRILNDGVGAWNNYRRFSRYSKINLSEADLSHSDMSGVDFSGADLSHANLTHTNLSHANLSHAELVHVRLSHANLSHADLILANLSHADLSSAKLCYAKLEEAALKGANFSEADLSYAKLALAELKGVNLSHAKLISASFGDLSVHFSDYSSKKIHRISWPVTHLDGANLSHADLTAAYLSHADLSHADLRDAILEFADFSEADLSDVDLQGCVLHRTIFVDTDLSNTKNLDLCHFLGPCVIDHKTIVKFKTLPLSFLRGCGLPESLIEYLPSLLNDPLQFYSCFISYSHKDEEFAKRLHADLQDKGVRCWFAPQDFKIGDKILWTIDQTIRIYDMLLVILSEHSVQSTWVEHEVEAALDKEAELRRTMLFPIRVDGTVMDAKVGWAAKIRRERHIGDFHDWKNHDAYQKAFDRLIHDLKADRIKVTENEPKS